MFQRNKSEIKNPQQLEIEGIVVTLDDVRLENHNDASRFNIKRKTNKKRDRSNSSRSKSKSSSSESGDHDHEDFEDYRVDGYHPCHVGEIIDSKYVLLQKLGWGHFSCVWLAFKLSDKNLYALKILKSAKKYTESAFEEEDILYTVASNYKDPKWESFLRKYYKDEKLEATRDHTHNLQMFD